MHEPAAGKCGDVPCYLRAGLRGIMCPVWHAPLFILLDQGAFDMEHLLPWLEQIVDAK